MSLPNNILKVLSEQGFDELAKEFIEFLEEHERVEVCAVHALHLLADAACIDGKLEKRLLLTSAYNYLDYCLIPPSARKEKYENIENLVKTRMSFINKS